MPAAASTSAQAGSATADTAQDKASVAIFQKSWRVYQTLLEHDSMHHTELYGAIRSYLEAKLEGRASFTMLDLGCGDSDYLARIVAASPALSAGLAAYTGVDMSAAALELSATNMAAAAARPGAALAHREGDMVAAAEEAAAAGQRYDVVLGSFSLHHLSPANKQETLAAVGQLLAPGGTFVLCDIFLAPGQTRPDYMADFHREIQGYPGLDEEGLDHVWAHVSAYDLPEEAASWQAWAAAAAAAPAAATAAAQGQQQVAAREGGGGPLFGRVATLAEVSFYKVMAFEAAA